MNFDWASASGPGFIRFWRARERAPNSVVRSTAQFLKKTLKLPLTAETALSSVTVLFVFLTLPTSAQIAQLAEHVLGKDEVAGSNPVLGSRSTSQGFSDVKLPRSNPV